MRAENATSRRMWIDGNDGEFSRFENKSQPAYIPKMGMDLLHKHIEGDEESPDCTAMVKLYGKNESSLWIGDACQNQHSFICKRPAMDYRYQFIDEEKTFKAAQEFCVAQGGILATLDEKKEKKIGGLIHVGVNYWIGITTENKLKNKIAWINGEPVSYTNFRKDQE